MILIIALAVLAAWGTIATLVELPRDGYRQTPTDWRRLAARDRPEHVESGRTPR